MRSPRSSSWRAWTISGGAAVLVLLVGALLVRVGRSPADRPDEREPTERTAEDEQSDRRRRVPHTGPAVAHAGVPSGFTADEDGAVTAAVAFATASQRWLYRTDEEIASAVAEMTTRQGRDRLTREIVDQIRTARERLGGTSGRIWWLVRPLAWRVEHYSPDEAQVSVWVVSVLAAVGVAAPQAEWTTVTLDVSWFEESWRVDAVNDTPGPTPMTGPGDEPWNAQPFDDALEGFTRVSGETVS